MMTEEDGQAMIELIRVSKVYPPDIQALADISLRINKGEICYLTGMSGAGKTTLLRMLCGIDTPDRGYIEVAGKELNKLTGAQMQELRRSIGVAYQDFKLLPDKTVAQNIAFSMEVAYRSRSFIRQRTGKLLSLLRLSDKVNTRAGKLSRGEQQRVSIARAVANDPVLLLADEPTGNLDTETTELVMDLFHHYNEKGTTLLIATHDHSIYNYPGSKVVTIEQGRMLIAGESNDFGESTEFTKSTVPIASTAATGVTDTAATLKAAKSGHQEDKLGDQIIMNRDLGDLGDIDLGELGVLGDVRRKGAGV
ncbi:cell division transport system ATP-binding protein [Candidatus Electrothrix marina]|jgi:cell division transport system ATP-binding protein|uniref:Cell division ATP-binding protein FtsE n=1 Tax=Candidatus Electrothrix marina TaxID=1859130 RepID=A0A444JGU0_9BACT|nr:cell division transport system ATP-binding protein [Candidatus Electrothrix marina]